MTPNERRALLHDAGALLVCIRVNLQQPRGLLSASRLAAIDEAAGKMAERLFKQAEPVPSSERVTWYCEACGSRHVQAEAWCSLSDDAATGLPQGSWVEFSQGGRHSYFCRTYEEMGLDGAEASVTEDRREAAAARLARRKERAA